MLRLIDILTTFVKGNKLSIIFSCILLLSIVGMSLYVRFLLNRIDSVDKDMKVQLDKNTRLEGELNSSLTRYEKVKESLDSVSKEREKINKEISKKKVEVVKKESNEKIPDVIFDTSNYVLEWLQSEADRDKGRKNEYSK